MVPHIGVVVMALTILMCLLGTQMNSEILEGQAFKDVRFKHKNWFGSIRQASFQSFMLKLRREIYGIQWGTVGFCLGFYLFRLTGVALALGLISWGSYVKYNRMRLKWKCMKIQRELPQFFGILQGWSEVNNNLIYCLEKAVESSLSSVVIQPYKQCVREVKSGVPVEQAIVNLKENVETDTQKHFVFCLMETNRRQGRLADLFRGFESEASQIWMEIQKTSLLQLQYRILNYSLFIFAILLLYLLLKYNGALGYFYLRTALGNQVLTSLSLMSALAYVREAFGKEVKK